MSMDLLLQVAPWQVMHGVKLLGAKAAHEAPLEMSDAGRIQCAAKCRLHNTCSADWETHGFEHECRSEHPSEPAAAAAAAAAMQQSSIIKVCHEDCLAREHSTWSPSIIQHLSTADANQDSTK